MLHKFSFLLLHFVLKILNFPAQNQALESVPSRVQAEGVFLGCFVTWKNTDNLKLKHNNSEPAIVLTRGDWQLSTNWHEIKVKLPDFTQVQSELCDIPCPTEDADNGARIAGSCGGNFFLSAFCIKPANNSLEIADACAVPREIISDSEYSLSENLINYSDLDHTCVHSGGTLGQGPMTYLPRNSPVDCTTYCNERLQRSTVEAFSGVALIQTPLQSSSVFPFNCFCLEPLKVTDLVSRTVAEENCFQLCVNCSSTETFLSVYTVKWPREGSLVTYNVTLDTRSPLPWEWKLACPYYPTVESFNETLGCEVDIAQPVNAPALGLWCNCPNFQPCLIHYAAPVALQAIYIRYYMRPGPRKATTPAIILFYRSLWDREQIKRHLSSGEGWDVFKLQFPTATGLIFSPEILIKLDSSFNPVTGLDFVTIDSVTLTLVRYEEYNGTSTVHPVPDEGQIVLDTLRDIQDPANGFYASPECRYKENYTELQCPNLCKLPEGNEDRRGFWSNCRDPSCVLSHVVSGDRIPIGILLFGYIKNSNADADFPVQLTVAYGSVYENVTVEVHKDGWFDHWYLPLENLEQGNFVSVNMSTAAECSFVMIDKIVLQMTPQPSVTTTATTSAPTTPIACEELEMCKAVDHRGMEWLACRGDTQRQPCPDGATGNVTWTCLFTGDFERDGPNYDSCSSDWYADIEEGVVGAIMLPTNLATAYLTQMEQMTGIGFGSSESRSPYYGHEIEGILTLSDQILLKIELEEKFGTVENLTEMAVAVHRNVLVNPTPWKDLDEVNEVTTGTKLIESLEAIAFGLTGRAILQGRGKNYEKRFEAFPEISATTRSTEKFNGRIFYPSDHENADVSIEIPTTWAQYFPNQSIVDFVGISIASTYANRIFLDSSAQTAQSHVTVNGNFMSFTFGTGDLKFSGNHHAVPRMNFNGTGVRLKFKHQVPAWGSEVKDIRRKLHTETGEQPKAVLDGSNSCVYWDTMGWSSAGCKLVEQAELHSVCECNHLSSFAILMRTHNYLGKDEILEWLTWIICPISIFCLALCVIVYSMPSIAAIRGPRSVITNNLCICLLAGNLILLVFSDKNYIHLNQGFCTTFGIMGHYFFLAAFFWMAFEGYVLYKVLIVVFDDGKDHFTMQYLASYGTPGVIVAVTGFTAIALRHDAYESDLYCWLTGDYIWAFSGPIALIIAGNSVMLFLSVRKAMTLAKNTTIKTHRRTNSIITWIKGCVSLMSLLGTTWVIGYFMLIDSNVVSNIAAYLFTILNASQGIFLFIFHVCLNKKIRQALRKRLTRAFTSSDKTMTTGSSNAPRPITVRLKYKKHRPSIFRT